MEHTEATKRCGKKWSWYMTRMKAGHPSNHECVKTKAKHSFNQLKRLEAWVVERRV